MNIGSLPIGSLSIKIGDDGKTMGRTLSMYDAPDDHFYTGPIALPLDDQMQRQDFVGMDAVRNAASSLWQKQNTQINIFDPSSIMRVQQRVKSGIFSMEPTEDELNAFVAQLRQNGLSDAVDLNALQANLLPPVILSPEQLGTEINYIASEYVTAANKLHTAEDKQGLADVLSTAKNALAERYLQSLQKGGFTLSAQQMNEVKSNFDRLVQDKIEGYEGQIARVVQQASEVEADGVWLKNEQSYIASMLRQSTAQTEASGAAYSLRDLTIAGKLAQAYQAEIDLAKMGSQDEAKLALSFALADMKAETYIAKGLVGQGMAALLQNQRPAARESALSAMDGYLSARENNRLSGEVQGSFAPVDRQMFDGIYQAAMTAFGQNGGNGAAALQSGASAGKTMADAAQRESPQVLRFGENTMGLYWKNFYQTPKVTLNALDRQVEKLLAQDGQKSTRGLSTYQRFTSDWHSFVSEIDGGLELFG